LCAAVTIALTVAAIGQAHAQRPVFQGGVGALALPVTIESVVQAYCSNLEQPAN
jgi:hypothetical protein